MAAGQTGQGSAVGFCTNSPNRCFTAAARRAVPRPTPDAKCPECGAALAARPSGRGVGIGVVLAFGVLLLLALAGVGVLALWPGREAPSESAAPEAVAPGPAPPQPAPESPAATSPVAPATPSPSPAAAEAYLRLSGDRSIARHVAPALVRVWLTAEGATDIAELREADGDLKETGSTLIGAHLGGRRITVSIRASDTDSGLADLASGAVDAAFGSRPDAPDVTRHLVGYEALAVIVPPASAIRGVSLADLRRIYAGAARSEAPFGGPPGGFNRFALASEVDALRSLVMGDAPLRAAHLANDPQRLERDVLGSPNAIAVVRPQDVHAAHVVPILDAAGHPVAPTDDAIRNGAYPLARPVFLYTATPPAREAIDQFVGIAISGAGQQTVREAGLVPPGP